MDDKGGKKDERRAVALKKQTAETIRRFRMIRSGDTVLAGVSGGADSVCLLALLRELAGELDFTLHAMHINHGLRGEAAEEDEEYVRSLCRKLNVPCTVRRVPVTEYAAAQGIGIEEAARILRYRALREQAAELEKAGRCGGVTACAKFPASGDAEKRAADASFCGAAARAADDRLGAAAKRVAADAADGAVRIAVAHHREDQAETVLMHLCRGTGLTGLGGMRPVSGALIRPLLFSSRAQLEDFLRIRGLTWREDASNADEAYTRNRVRREVLPLLAARVNGQAAAHIAETAREVAEAADYLETQAQAALEQCLIEPESGCNFCLDVNVLRTFPPLLRRRVLLLALAAVAGRRRDLQRRHAEALEALALREKSGGALSLPYGVEARREYGRLYFYRKKAEKALLGAADAGSSPLLGHFDEKEAKSLPVVMSCDAGDAAAAPSASDCGGLASALPIPVCGKVIFEPSAPDCNGLASEPSAPDCNTSFFSPPLPLSAAGYDCAVLDNPFPDGIVPQKKYTKWLDYDKIGAFPTFRTRRPGDWMTIGASGERKKLARLMIDAKLAPRWRERMVLPACGSEILWLPGVRISEAYRVGPRTKRVLRISLPEAGAESVIPAAGERQL